MFKLDRLATALGCVVLVAATMPAAQAATRSVEFSRTVFESRCLAQGGIMDAGAGGLICETADAAVRCDFVSLNLANCDWEGVDHQRGVNRLIGMADAESMSEGGGGNGSGGLRWKHRVVKF